MTTIERPAWPIWGARHAAIRVRDLEAAKDWYGNVLRMTLSDEFPDFGIFMRFGENYHHDLAIFKADPEAPQPHPEAVGLAHIALLVDSIEAVRQWYHWLKAQGVDAVRSSDHGVTRSIYFTDPDANNFEIYCDNADFNWRKDGLTIRDPLDLDTPAAS
jgi:catechol 2,3-dioxygenase